MVSETCRRLCKVQSCISIKPTSSTLFRLLSPFLDDFNKLAGTQAPFPESFNIVAAVFAGFKAPSRVYINKNVQDIIQVVIKKDLQLQKTLVKIFSSPTFITFIGVIIIQSAITFVSNMKIILLLLEQRNYIIFFLQYLFLKIRLVSTCNNISGSSIAKV